jgi:YD repeat-containing protein
MNYDRRKHQTKIIDANQGETKYSYFNDGQTKSVTDAVGNTTNYFYDDSGRLVREQLVGILPSNSDIRFSKQRQVLPHHSPSTIHQLKAASPLMHRD